MRVTPEPRVASPGEAAFLPHWRGLLDGVDAARRHQLYHYLEVTRPGPGSGLELDGHRLLNLTSNDYLALARHPEVVEGAVRAVREWGASSGGSPILGARFPLHLELESRLAALTGQEQAILFPSGYQGNLAVLTALAGPGDAVFVDRLVHASIVDGVKLSGAAMIPFRHNDVEDLESRLRTHARPRSLVVVESTYSMDGDGPDLKAVCAVAARHGALVVVDEAHSFGFAASGVASAVVAQGVEQEVGLVFGTLGKALGSQGSFVAGSPSATSFIQHASRPYVFSTAPAPALVGAALAALDVIAREPERVARLWELTHGLHARLRAEGFEIGTTTSPIVPVFVPERGLRAALQATALCRELRRRAVCAQLVVPPAVPQRNTRLRMQLRADLSSADLEHLVQALLEAARATAVLPAGARDERQATCASSSSPI